MRFLTLNFPFRKTQGHLLRAGHDHFLLILFPVRHSPVIQWHYRLYLRQWQRRITTYIQQHFKFCRQNYFGNFFFSTRGQHVCDLHMNTNMWLLLSLRRLFQQFVPNLAVHRSSTRSVCQLGRHSTTTVLNWRVALHRLLIGLWVREFTLKAS